MAAARYRQIRALCYLLVGAGLACAEGEAFDFVPDARAPTGAGVGSGGGVPGTSVGSSGASGSGSGGSAAGEATGSGGSASTAGSSGVGGSTAGAGSAGSGGTGGSGGSGGSGGGGGNAGTASGGAGMAGSGIDASVGTGGSAGAPMDASTEPPPACTTCKLKVQYQCRQDGVSVKEASYILKVFNTGTMPIALGSITLRYYYTIDSTAAQEANCDFATVGCGNVALVFKTVTPAKPKADRYLEVTLSGTGSIAAGADSGEIQIRMHDPTYQAMYTQTNDYSFASTGAIYIDAPTITAYSGGTNVWGTEP
jgi:cellulose 1,4-beta-cellobiosidase